MSRLTHRTISGLLWMAGSRGAHAMLQVLVLGVLARYLAPAEFGVVSAALVVIGLSAIFSQIGLGPAVVQRPVLERRHVETAFVASVGFGILLGAVVWLGAPVAARFFRMEQVEPVLRVLAWLFPLQGLSVVSEALVQRELRFRWLASRDVMAYAVGSGVVGVFLAMRGWGVWALVAATLAQEMVRAAILLALQPPPIRLRPDARALRELLYFGGGFTAARIGNYLALQGDNMVVGRFLGPAALGLYGRAYQLMATPATLFGNVLDSVLFPTMAKVQDDVPRLAATFRRGVALIALTILPLSATIFLLAPEVIAVLLGPGWTEVVVPLRILVVGMLFRTSYKMSDSLARATGRVYRRAWRQGVYAVLVIAGAWIGQHQGIRGVALGVTAAVVINFLLMAQLSLRIIGVSWRDFWRAQRPALALTAASWPVLWGVATTLRGWEVPAVGVLLGTVGATSVVALGLVGTMPAIFLGRDGRWMLQAMRGYGPRLRLRHAWLASWPFPRTRAGESE